MPTGGRWVCARPSRCPPTPLTTRQESYAARSMDALPTADQLNLGLLLLRVVVGPVFAFHGFAKIFRGGRLDGTAGWFHGMGMRPGHIHACLAAGGELATGICIFLGLLTPFGGMGL